MVGLIVIAAFPVNHVPARSTILEFVSHHLTPQPAGAASSSSSSSNSAGSHGTSGSSSSGNGSSRSSGGGCSSQQVELLASAYTAETLLFCGVSTAVALSVTDLGEFGVCPMHRCWSPAIAPGGKLSVTASTEP